MDFKKIGLSLLFPHIAIMIILVPVSAFLLVYSMVFVGKESVLAVISYVFSAYTLTVWCFKIPYLIKCFKNFKENNKYLRIWRGDEVLRIKLPLYGALVFNTAYAVLQLCLGLYHKTFWYCSLAFYYLSLAVMRFFLVRHTRKFKEAREILAEYKKYRACGIVFLIMNLFLALIIFFMVYWGRTFNHHEITTIAMAAYTFTSLTFAIINVIKYNKRNNPIYSASKAISLASAAVSILTLEATMLTTFGKETMDNFTRQLFLALSGAGVSAFIIAMAVYMIIKANKNIKNLKELPDGK